MLFCGPETDKKEKKKKKDKEKEKKENALLVSCHKRNHCSVSQALLGGLIKYVLGSIGEASIHCSPSLLLKVGT